MRETEASKQRGYSVNCWEVNMCSVVTSTTLVSAIITFLYDDLYCYVITHEHLHQMVNDFYHFTLCPSPQLSLLTVIHDSGNGVSWVLLLAQNFLHTHRSADRGSCERQGRGISSSRSRTGTESGVKMQACVSARFLSVTFTLSLPKCCRCNQASFSS